MSIARIDIINLGIILTGAKKVVGTTDNTKAARLASMFWELSYKGMLELPVNWKFSTTREEITGDVTTAPAIGSYSYRYKLPKKCLRVISQIDERDEDIEYTHIIENYVDSSEDSYPVIMTNTEKCFIKFIYDLGQDNEIGRWPAWFARLVALDLAIMICEPMTQDKVKKNQLMIQMLDPSSGWFARAVQADGMYGAIVNDDLMPVEQGNRDVLDAAARRGLVKRYIFERE